MKILILGGTGAIGVHLIDILNSRGEEIFITSRNKHENNGKIKYIKGNAQDNDFLISLLQQQWDCIVDFMVYTTDQFKQRIDLLLPHTKQFLFLSSARVYSDTRGVITEETPKIVDVCNNEDYLATEEYALIKGKTEKILQNSKYTNWTIIRPYITYSEYRLQLGVLEKEQWLYRAMQGRTIVFSSDIAKHLTTLTYGYDVARGIASVIGEKKALQQTFHITTTESRSWQDLMQIYLDVLEDTLSYRPNILLTGQSTRLVHPNFKYQVLYDRLYNRQFDNSKIGNFIDISSFVNPEHQLSKCLKSFLENPNFNAINWAEEAYFDRLTGERAKRREFNNFKSYIKYLLFRYLTKRLK